MIKIPNSWIKIKELPYHNNHRKPLHLYYGDNGEGIGLMFLTQGQFALIDWSNLHKITEYNWYAKNCGKYGYAVVTDVNYKNQSGKRSKDTMFLHQLLTNTFKSEKVCDHINIDFPESFELDNRMCNLKVTTSSVNQKNRRLSSNNTSGNTGVVYSKKDRGYFGRVHFMDTLPYSPLFSVKRFGSDSKAKECAIIFTETLREYLYSGDLYVEDGVDEYVVERIKEYIKRLPVGEEERDCDDKGRPLN